MKPEALVQNYKEQLAALRDNASKEIHYICETIGPRPCGEAGETKAQEHLMDVLKPMADAVTRETYKVHPDAFMAFVPVAGSLLIGATGLNFLSAFKEKKAASYGALGLIGAALSAVVGEFVLYREYLDPLFPEKESGNVISIRKPEGEVKRRMILSGHTDSAPEWVYTYKLGSHGVVIVAAYAILGLLYSTVSSILSRTMKDKDTVRKLTLGQLAFLPAYALLYRFSDGKNYVPGGSDDLSGVMVGLSALKFLSDNDLRLKNTEVIILHTGGEECGLRGAKAFCKAHPELLNDGVETVYLGFDTVRDEDYTMIYKGDMSGVVRNGSKAVALMKKAAAEAGLDVPVGTIPLGSTDAAAMSQAGFEATCFVAMDPAPARYYHTRLDTADNIVPEMIEKGIDIAIRAIFDFDENGLPDA